MLLGTTSFKMLGAMEHNLLIAGSHKEEEELKE